MGKNDFHGSLGQALPLPSRAPYGKTLERVPKFSYLGVVLDGEPFLYGKITSSMLAARSVGGLGFCLVYDHASRRKPLNRYTHHFCSRYLIMLMLHGWKSQKGVAKSYSAYRTAQLELLFGRTPQMTPFMSLTG